MSPDLESCMLLKSFKNKELESLVEIDIEEGFYFVFYIYHVLKDTVFTVFANITPFWVKYNRMHFQTDPNLVLISSNKQKAVCSTDD